MQVEAYITQSAIALEDATNIQKAAKNGGWPPLLALGGPSAAPGAIPARRPGAPGGPTAAAAPPPPPPKDTAPPPSKQLIEALQEEEDGEVLVGVNTDIETHINRANRLLAVSFEHRGVKN